MMEENVASFEAIDELASRVLSHGWLCAGGCGRGGGLLLAPCEPIIAKQFCRMWGTLVGASHRIRGAKLIEAPANALWVGGMNREFLGHGVRVQTDLSGNHKSRFFFNHHRVTLVRGFNVKQDWVGFAAVRLSCSGWHCQAQGQ